MSNQHGPRAAEYEELGRFVGDFTFLEKTLHLLCAGLVVPRDAVDESDARAGAVAAEVDTSRLCSSVIKRLISESPHADVRALAVRWKALSSKILAEIEWRNTVAHSWWSLTLAPEGLALQKQRRGAITDVTVDLISGHRKAVQRLGVEVLSLAAIARPAMQIEVEVERLGTADDPRSRP